MSIFCLLKQSIIIRFKQCRCMLLFYDSKSVLYSDNNQSYLLETSTSTWLLGRVIQSMKFKVELTKLHCYLVPAKCSLIMIVFTLQPIYSKKISFFEWIFWVFLRFLSIFSAVIGILWKRLLILACSCVTLFRFGNFIVLQYILNTFCKNFKRSSSTGFEKIYW